MTLGYTIVLLLMALVVAANYLRYRDLLYPPVVHGGAWTLAVLLYVLNSDRLLPLSPVLIVVVVAGMLLFTFGSYLATRHHDVPRVALPEVSFEPKEWFAKLLFWLPLLGLPLFLVNAYQLGQDGPFDSIYRNIRLARLLADDQTAGGPFGLTAYLLPVAYTSVLVQTVLGAYRRDRRRYAVSLLVALTYAFFSTGRSPVILLLLSVAGVLLVTRRASRARTLGALAAAVFAVFGAMGAMAGLTGETDGSLTDTLGSVVDLLVVYALGPLAALDQYMQLHLHDTAWGENIFRTVYAVLNRMGFDVEVAPLVQDYVNVPFPTNVYTVYQPYFTDFAFAGIAMAAAGLGYLHGWLYRKATQGHLVFVGAYGLSLYPLLFQFYQDNYFSLLSLWLQYGLLLFLYFYRVRLIEPECTLSTSSS